MKINKEAIRQILDTAMRLDQKGLVNAIEGNISVRDGDLVYITPSGKNKAYLTEDMIAILDMDGNQVGGSCKASSEYKLHLHAYKVRPDVKGVVHCHPPYLTAYAICGKPVTTNAYPEMIVVFGQIRVAAYGRPGTDAISAEADIILKDDNVVLLENHGAVSVGKTLHDAMNTMEASEATARILTIAKQVGPIKDLPPKECEALWEMHRNR